MERWNFFLFPPVQGSRPLNWCYSTPIPAVAAGHPEGAQLPFLSAQTASTDVSSQRHLLTVQTMKRIVPQVSLLGLLAQSKDFFL